MNKVFEQRETKKRYVAICRGFMKDEDVIDYPLFNEDLKREQEAITHYKCLQKREIDIPSGKFQTSRYSLTEFIPITGRMHQIRRHAAHIFHPIIADRPHGCNKQNKLFIDNFNLYEMMLHAEALSFVHPFNGEYITLNANFSSEFLRISALIGFDLNVNIS
jgi:tRNA pseudouridine65 synthase